MIQVTTANPDTSELTADAELWLVTGKQIAQRRSHLSGQASAQMWELGDWLIAGEDQYLQHMDGRTVRRIAAQISGYSAPTLAMAASVSRRLDPATRRESLTWWHHLAVTKLPRPEQEAWLERAVEHGYSARRLQEEMRQAGLIETRSFRHGHADKVVLELVKLTREQITRGTLDELIVWWQREVEPMLAELAP
jgi:hypothetical protein